ncbi:DUF4333 domain-containing protein [Amycolatopsis sp. NPDC004368]
MTQPPQPPEQPQPPQQAQQWWQPPAAPAGQDPHNPGQWQQGAWQQPQQNPWSQGTPAQQPDTQHPNAQHPNTQHPNTGGQQYANPQQYPSGAQLQPYPGPAAQPYPTSGPQHQPYANPASGPQQQPYATPASGPHQQPYAGQQVPGVPPQQQGFGGGFQPTTYGGLGAFSAEAVQKAPRSRKPWLIGGAVVVVAVLGGGAAWLLGAFRGDTLEQKSLQDGVSKVLAENYGEPDVKNVSCPSGESTQNGTTFDCTLQLGGQPRKVTVRVLNDKPEYEVGAPH